jgi:hypothetical protein
MSILDYNSAELQEPCECCVRRALYVDDDDEPEQELEQEQERQSEDE